jgi:hypothetical protein
MNQIRMVRPYRKHGLWVFDDEDHKLVAEAFVMGASEMIDRHIASRGIKMNQPFRLLFSHEPFPRADNAHLDEPAYGGGWYMHRGHEAWLCPALFCYFDELPQIIYFNAEVINEDANHEA